MQALRRTISGTVAACVAVTASLVIASAPAASSRQDGRLLVTSAAAQRYAGAVERTNVAWPRRESVSRSITARGAMLAVRPASVATASSGRVRVVIETSNPTLARESVRAVGGRIERSAAGLVQAIVTPRAETALAGKAGVDRVRPPYAQIQTA